MDHEQIVAKHIEKLAAELRRHEDIIAQHREAIKTTEAQITALRDLQAEITSTARRSAVVEPMDAGMDEQTDIEPMKPADAVRWILGEHPEGLPQKTVVLELEDRIASDASDRKRLLYNTIFNLKKRGHIHEVGGKLVLNGRRNM